MVYAWFMTQVLSWINHRGRKMTTRIRGTPHLLKHSRSFALVCLAFLATALNLVAAPQVITNKKTLWSAWMSAKSPEDHMRLAAYYRAEAERLRDKQKQEEDLAKYYLEHAINYRKQFPTPYQNAAHLAEYYRQAADDAQATADGNAKVAQELNEEAKAQAQE
jgi:hypothetical protein